MSEGSPEPTGAGTAQVEDGSPGDGTDPEGMEPQAGTAEGDTDTATELAHWKDMARKNERRARENTAAARELATLKQQGMTDLEKAQTERDEAKRERDEARADHSRVMAAATHDLPVELIDYLGSGTDDEIGERAEVIGGAIETRAQELFEDWKAQYEQQQGGGRNGFQGARPVESMRAGSAPSGGSEPRNTNDWFRSMVRPGD